MVNAVFSSVRLAESGACSSRQCFPRAKDENTTREKEEREREREREREKERERS